VIAAIPNFEASDFARRAQPAFVFDLARLHGRNDIPRPFPHRHGYYHVLWMTAAEGEHVIDFEPYAVRPNSVFFISPGQVHAWASRVPIAGYMVNFSIEFFLDMFPKPDALAEFPFFHLANTEPVVYLDDAEAASLAPLLDEIEAEFLGDQPWRHDIMRSLFLVFLTRLRRLYRPAEPERRSPQSFFLTKKYKLLIEQHYRQLGSVQDYAALLNVTDRALNEATKKAAGKTAGQLIHERILLEAKRLLIQSGQGISEIAYALGFEDPAYFCRFFKKGTALTPGEFKRRHARPL
jgi:AraC family transcriptional regulator, transcriptional activator of pobA